MNLIEHIAWIVLVWCIAALVAVGLFHALIRGRGKDDHRGW